MLSLVRADLHVHTVLSPCAEYRMVPRLIVERAGEAGIDLLAITDHNSGENAGAVVEAATGSGVSILPGMEVESREGVHLLAFFDTVGQLAEWQEILYRALPRRENVESVFGPQLVVDSNGNLVTVNRRLLMTSTDLSVEQVVAEVAEAGGLCIPAHVDRPSYGLLGVLGMIPQGFASAAFEISPYHTPESSRERFPELRARTVIRSSDAHTLEDIGKASTIFQIAGPSVRELSMACRGELGRMVV